MRWWERQIGGETRGRLIALIRRGVRTVEELASAMRVTDNAVRAQIQTLERDGVVDAVGTRRGAGAGKPATLYGITPEAEVAFSSAYAPVLAAMLRVLGERLTASELDDVLRESGRRLAPGVTSPSESTPLDARVRAAQALLNTLGAEIDVARTPNGFELRGHACPLAAAVNAEPHACHAVESLVAAIVRSPVREHCDRSEGARCRFEVPGPAL
jgi:predicted ArsR family transcriptional regulator